MAGSGLALGDVEFAVVDLETTGFSPRLHDRVVEVAVVRVSPDGSIEDGFCTLVDPERDVGPTHVHGIRASDLEGAPRFRDIVGDLVARLDGAVLVAHNARFDLDFLRSEFTVAGYAFPSWPALCTLQLAYLLMPSAPRRRLMDCCAHFGIEFPTMHTAMGDAEATARLLAAFLRAARQSGVRELAFLGCDPSSFPVVTWPDLQPSGRSLARGAAQTVRATEIPYLARLVGRLNPVDVGSADVAAYLELLDRALEDRRVTEVEAAVLHETAEAWGLDQDDAVRAHRTYLDALADAALEDGYVSDLEREDLEAVCRLLGLAPEELDLALASAAERAPERRAVHGLEGKTVCFTGALIGRIWGVPITREQAHTIARAAGLEIRGSVTKDLDLLVVADPLTKSSKAEKARRIGTRVMAEPAFWATIGAPVE